MTPRRFHVVALLPEPPPPVVPPTKVLEALRQSSWAHLVWEVAVKKDVVWPIGVVLVSKKQLTVKVGEDFKL